MFTVVNGFVQEGFVQKFIFKANGMNIRMYNFRSVDHTYEDVLCEDEVLLTRKQAERRLKKIQEAY